MQTRIKNVFKKTIALMLMLALVVPMLMPLSVQATAPHDVTFAFTDNTANVDDAAEDLEYLLDDITIGEDDHDLFDNDAAIMTLLEGLSATDLVDGITAFVKLEDWVDGDSTGLIAANAAGAQEGFLFITQSLFDALETAVANAEAMFALYDDASNVTHNITTAQINTVGRALVSALVAFVNGVDVGTGDCPVSVAFEKLEELIEEAEEMFEYYEDYLCVDGATVLPTDRWVSQAALNFLRAAITTAEAEDDCTNCGTPPTDPCPQEDADDINDAYDALKRAMAQFLLMRLPGTLVVTAGEEAHADFTVAIGKAEALLASIDEIDGDVKVMEEDTFTVTFAQFTTFSFAITTAKNALAAFDPKDYTAPQLVTLRAAITALETATKTFEDQIKEGEVEPKEPVCPDPCHRHNIIKAWAELNALLDGLKVSADGSDVPPQYGWWTQAQYNFVKGGVFAAITSWVTDFVEESDCNNATWSGPHTNLIVIEEWIDYVNLVATPSEMCEANFALVELIEEAKDMRTETTESTDGTDVAPANYWATKAARDILLSAIETAEIISEVTGLPAGVYTNAASVLQAAMDVFEKARAKGTKADPYATNRATLRALIVTAEKYLEDTEVSTDGKDVAVGTFWVLKADADTFETAIETAETAADNYANNNLTLTNAYLTLRAAIEAFKAEMEEGTDDDKGSEPCVGCGEYPCECDYEFGEKPAWLTDPDDIKAWEDNHVQWAADFGIHAGSSQDDLAFFNAVAPWGPLHEWWQWLTWTEYVIENIITETHIQEILNDVTWITNRQDAVWWWFWANGLL